MSKARASIVGLAFTVLGISMLLTCPGITPAHGQGTAAVSAEAFQQLRKDVQDIRVACAGLRVNIRALDRRVARLEPNPVAQETQDAAADNGPAPVSISELLKQWTAIENSNESGLQKTEARDALKKLVVAGKARVETVTAPDSGSRWALVTVVTGAGVRAPRVTFQFEWDAAAKLKLGQMLRYSGQIGYLPRRSAEKEIWTIRLIKVVIE